MDMDKARIAENDALKEVLGNLIISYAQRDTNEDFSRWLSDKLCQEIPGITAEASKQLANDIVVAVADYDQTLQALNGAVEAGQSKEEWLSEQFAEVYADIPMDTAGEVLQSMETALISSNVSLMGEIDPSVTAGMSAAESESSDWNRYSVKAKANSIGQQISAAMLFAAANAIERYCQGENPGGIAQIISDALQGGLKAPQEEVKAVVAGAVQVAVEHGLADKLPVEIIASLAGVAVEGSEALYDAANGDITITEALDKIGRAGIAAGCRVGAGALREGLMKFPVAGFLLVDLLGGLFDYMDNSQFDENLYTTIQGVAVATWEGIAQSDTVRTLNNLRYALN